MDIHVFDGVSVRPRSIKTGIAVVVFAISMRLSVLGCEIIKKRKFKKLFTQPREDERVSHQCKSCSQVYPCQSYIQINPGLDIPGDLEIINFAM